MSLNKFNNICTPYLNPYVGSLKLYNTTSNYNPSSLNYFEEYENETIIMKDQFNQDITITFHLNLQRIGNYTHLLFHCPSIFNVKTNTDFIINSLSGIIPARFRPIEPYTFIGLTSNGDPTQHIGRFEFDINGNIKIFLDYEKNKQWKTGQNNQIFGLTAIFRIN